MNGRNFAKNKADKDGWQSIKMHRLHSA